MGGPPCKAKALLNGLTIQNEVEALMFSIEQVTPDELYEKLWYAVVENLNYAEDAVFRAKRCFLETQGFNGPWPHSMLDMSELEMRNENDHKQ